MSCAAPLAGWRERASSWSGSPHYGIWAVLDLGLANFNTNL